MTENERGHSHPVVALLGGSLMAIVAALGLFMYSGGSFGPHKAGAVSVLPAGPGAAGD